MNIVGAPTNNSSATDGDDRILHGTKASPNEFPYMVSIQDFEGNNKFNLLNKGVRNIDNTSLTQENSGLSA